MKLSSIIATTLVSSCVTAIWPPPKPTFHLQLEGAAEWNGKFITVYLLADAPFSTLHVVDEEPTDGQFEFNDTVVSYQSGMFSTPVALSFQDSNTDKFQEAVVTSKTPHTGGFSVNDQDFLEYNCEGRWVVCNTASDLGYGQVFFAKDDSSCHNGCTKIQLKQKMLPMILSGESPTQG